MASVSKRFLRERFAKCETVRKVKFGKKPLDLVLGADFIAPWPFLGFFT